MWLFLIAAVILFRWGYEYGRNDHMQTAAYAMYLNDNSLFGGDWYIQHIHSRIPNERFVFSWIYSLTGSYQEVLSFPLHVILLLVHLYLWYRIGAMFIRNHVYLWVWLLTLFILLYGLNTGGNELYYRSFFVSNLAKTAGLAGIWLMLRKRYHAAFLIFGGVTMLQPVVGIQLAVVSALAVMPWWKMPEYTLNLKKWLTACSLYAVTGGAWVLGLRFYFAETPVDTALFYKVLFQFRVPHHCMPFSFSVKGYLLLIFLITVSMLVYTGRNNYLYRFMAIGTAILLFTIPAVEWMNQVDITSLQWFKLTIWMQAIGLLAVFIKFEEKFHRFVPKLLRQWIKAGIIGAGLFSVIGLVNPQKLSPFRVTYDYIPAMQKDASVRMAQTIKAVTPPNAVLLHPIRFTELRVYGQRSSAADYKILVHRKATMIEWFERMQKVYGADLEQSTYGLGFYPEADDFYFSLSTNNVLSLAAEYGVSHFLTEKHHNLELPVWAMNEKYVLYGIP